MKSVAIFLALVFLTGFQAAVLSEESPPSIPEPDQSILEQFQEQFGKVSTQVTNSVNGGLEAVKGRASDVMAYTVDLGKRYTPPKFMNRKLYHLCKDFYTFTQSLLGQGKETMKDQFKKVGDMLEEVKKHPATVAVNEEVFIPFTSKCVKFANWMGDQSVASVYNMVQKKLSF